MRIIVVQGAAEMNICMFTNTYLPFIGGIARSVQYYTEDLRELGHDVLVVAPRYNRQGQEDEGELRIPAIQKVYGSDFAVRLPVPFVVDWRIQEFNPQIIHSHHPFIMGDTALRVARKRKLPLIFTHHTMYEQYVHYVPVNTEPFRQFVIRLATLYANLCDGVVAPSRSVADILRERGVTTPIVEIPSGVSTDALGSGDGAGFRREMEIPLNARVVGHVGRLAPEKNLRFLAAAVAHFLARHAEACFLVVGRGPSEPEILDICRRAGVAQRLIQAGQLDGRLLCDAYQAMDLFVFASHTETQGMVLAEAMAAGKPVIALDAPGAREVIADGINGRLLPPTASEHDFSAAIKHFFDHPAVVPWWSAAARHTALNFSRETCAKKMASYYRSVIEADETARAADSQDFAWDALSQRLRIEWKLLSQKTQAMAGALMANWSERQD